MPIFSLSKDPADAAKVPGGDLGTRQAYIKYVDSMQTSGMPTVPYEQWKQQLIKQLATPQPPQPMPVQAPNMPVQGQ